MADAKLRENEEKQGQTKIKSDGKKAIHEILYFPRISENLDVDSEEHIQQVWVLEGKRYDSFIVEAKKYSDASQKLEEAQKSGDTAQIKTAQDAVRKTLSEGFGNESDNSVNPIPQGGYKNLIECIGYINKKTFFISNSDLQKIKNEKGKSNFRFKTNTMKTIERDLMSSMEAAVTDSNDGTTDDRLKNEFWEIKAEIKKQWNITDEILETRKIKKLLPEGSIIRDFILSDENCEMVDTAVKYFNDTANASKNQKEQKLKTINSLLSKKDGEFSHHDWGKVLIGIHEIWGKKEPNYSTDLKNEFEKIPYELEIRKDLQVELNKKELPTVIWDASAGAQLMRFTSNVTAEASFNLKDKISAKVSADAKLSLAEAGAEANAYFPNNNGFKMEFAVPIRKEKLVPRPIATVAELEGSSATFALDSFLVLPNAIAVTAKNLEQLLFQEANTRRIEDIIVNVIGHTDALGSHAYNLKLGEHRAKATFEVFANNYSAWHGYLEDTGKFSWGTIEKDFMILTNWLVLNDFRYFEDALIHTPIGNEEKLIDILKRLYSPLADSKTFPHEKLETPEIISMCVVTNTIVPNIDGNVIQSTFSNIMGIADSYIPFEKYSLKIQNKAIVYQYFNNMIDYALKDLIKVKKSYLDLFYHDCVSLPYLSKGEFNLIENTSEASTQNRRIELQAWQLNPEPYFIEETINLGTARFKLNGMVGGFVGATIALSANIDINTSGGTVQVVGKQNAGDKVSKYDEKGKIDADTDGQNNVTGKLDLFAGAKAEAGIALALQWKNPDITIKNPSSEFKTLASVGGSVMGTLGIGLEAEFKIGFDKKSGTFQIKGKAQATWGFGCGGAVCLGVGVEELWEFASLVFTKLKDSDFNFIDIFEGKTLENGEKSESDIDVYGMYNSWIVEQFLSGNIISATGGVAALGAFKLLENADDLLRKWNDKNRAQEEAEKMIEALKSEPVMASYLPPEAKGRLLYLLTRYKEVTWQDLGKTDLHSYSEEAAVFLITKGVVSLRDWQQTMEHMAIKIGDEYEQYEKQPGVTYTVEQKATRATNNVVYLRNQLLDEPEDWNKVQNHLDKLKKEALA